MPREESAAITDFRRPLFDVVHVPDLPQINHYELSGGINDIGSLRDKWADIDELYNRLPNNIWMDYYDRGFNGLFNPDDPPAPALFVNELNSIWRSLPELTGVAHVFPPPNANGWNNTNVQVSLSGTGGSIRTIISRAWLNPAVPKDTDLPATQANYLVQSEGVTTIGFNAIGDRGKKSPTKLVDVGIDKTPPIITGMLDRPPDVAGWYASNVTAHFECSDALSGIAFCPSDVVLSRDGANQSVTGTAQDRADNQSSTTITNINIDETPPVIRAAANPTVLWPPNNKLVNVVVTGQMTDAVSGVDPATATYAVTDEYRLIQPNGKITLGRTGSFSFTLRLEARRLGNDKDGRCYLIGLKARDRAGHPSEVTLTVTVPHDQGKN